MKTCPVCALDLEDTYLFCPDDGSTLNSLPGRLSEIKSTSTPGRDDETAGAVVLYCPACAAEYPLTFSSCPVHGMKLTKHRIPKSSSGASSLREPGAGTQATVTGPQIRGDQYQLTRHLTTLDLKRPQIESPSLVTPIEPGELDNESANSVELNEVESSAAGSFADSNTAFDCRESAADFSEPRLERPGFRLAAVATVMALALFGLVAVYTFVSNFSRRSQSSAGRTANTPQSAPEPLPFVATPQAAQDYKEDTQDPSPSRSVEQPSEPTIERVHRDSAPSPTEHAVRKNPDAYHIPKAPAATPPPVTTTRVSNPPLPALPRGNSGGFDARLIRVRSRKTPAGFRYDLTFNMQEQAGRSAHWQRVLISTRSTSGASHSEAIPFSHRLGAAGALTFTISIEMAGRSEADWQGRVVCTTLGWDNKGAALQASFGANVTP
jgi:hypothetical protein